MKYRVMWKYPRTNSWTNWSGGTVDAKNTFDAMDKAKEVLNVSQFKYKENKLSPNLIELRESSSSDGQDFDLKVEIAAPKD